MSTQEGQITLGSLQVSPLGIGTWAWGDPLVWGYKKQNDPDLQMAFQASLAAGINFFDTAELYGFGHSERLLNRFMHATDRSPDRSIVIATKFMPLPWRFRKQNLLSALHGSLRRLGLSKVDLYQIHWPAPPVPIERWMDALADAVDAGLTRIIGVSNYSVAQMRLAHATLAKRGVKLASNQVEYSLLTRDPERNGLLDACRELGVTLIAYSPLAMGLLTAKYTPDNPPKGYRARQYKSDYLGKIQPLISLLRQIGAIHDGKTPAQVALNWTICKGTIPIPGAKNARQAQDNAGALGWRLTDAEVAMLDAAEDKLHTDITLKA